MTSTVYQYRMYCNVENAYTYEWGTSEPTLCPNDHANRENISGITIIETVSSNQTDVTGIVTAKDFSPEDGWYQSTSIHVPIPTGSPGDIIVHDWTMPFDMYIWSASLSQPPNSNGDIFTYALAIDTTIAVIGETGATGATAVNIGPDNPSFYYVTKGLEFSLTDGVNTEYPGMVTSYDKSTGSISFQTPLNNLYEPGTAFRFTNFPIRDHIMDYQGDRMFFAHKGLKSKIVPAGLSQRIIYTNNTGHAKDIYFQIEYYMT